MIEIIYAADGTRTTVDRRKADKHGAWLKSESSARCRKEILAYASEEDQRNAAIGATISGDHTAAKIAQFVACRRAEHAARKAAVQAVLDGTGTNAEKLAALDALQS